MVDATVMSVCAPRTILKDGNESQDSLFPFFRHHFNYKSAQIQAIKQDDLLSNIQLPPPPTLMSRLIYLLSALFSGNLGFSLLNCQIYFLQAPKNKNIPIKHKGIIYKAISEGVKLSSIWIHGGGESVDINFSDSSNVLRVDGT